MYISSVSLTPANIEMELKSLLDPLLKQEKLLSSDVLNQADKIEEFVLKTTLSLEVEGNFEAAINLYERVADTLMQASKKIPIEDREIICSLVDLWFSTIEAKRSASLIEPLKHEVSLSPPSVESSENLLAKQAAMFPNINKQEKMITSPAISRNSDDKISGFQISKPKQAEKDFFKSTEGIEKGC
jgi:hypothetical protein